MALDAELTAVADALLDALPPHDAGLILEHNPGRGRYQTVAAWLSDRPLHSGEPDWPSPEARRRAIDADDVWVLRWSPDTAVGSYEVAAPTLAELLAMVLR